MWAFGGLLCRGAAPTVVASGGDDETEPSPRREPCGFSLGAVGKEIRVPDDRGFPRQESQSNVFQRTGLLENIFTKKSVFDQGSGLHRWDGYPQHGATIQCRPGSILFQSNEGFFKNFVRVVV